MQVEWTDTERSVLLQFGQDHLTPAAIDRYCQAKSEDAAQMAVSDMMQVPPNFDRARNHAAAAQFYRDFMADLLRMIEKV